LEQRGNPALWSAAGFPLRYYPACELVSLVNYATSNPAIDNTAFPNTPASYFWSSTVYAPDPASVRYVSFLEGGTNAFNSARSSNYHVRLVRSGQSFGAFDGLAPAPAPSPPNPIPTLSEWAQSMMILLLIVTAGFYGWRMKPR